MSAQKALDDGRVDDALRLARFGVERAEGPTTLELLARILLADASMRPPAERARGRAEAADLYVRAADAAPGSAALQHSAALVLDVAGQRDAALAFHDRAVALASNDPTLRLHRANLRLRVGDAAGAAEDHDRLVALAPDGAWTHALEAELLLARKEPDAARRAAEEARRRAPADPAIRVLLARVERSAGEPARAVELLSAVEPAERDRALVTELALAWRDLDRPDRAADAWEAFAQQQPGELDPLLESVRARLAAGDRLRASVWLDRARLLAPEDPAIAELAAIISAGSTPPS